MGAFVDAIVNLVGMLGTLIVVYGALWTVFLLVPWVVRRRFSYVRAGEADDDGLVWSEHLKVETDEGPSPASGSRSHAARRCGSAPVGLPLRHA